MKDQLLHTPEGVRDIYSVECEKKQVIEEVIHKEMKCYGYHPIQTPTFEFFDIFGKQIGTTPSKDLYKFFDREGNTLVLRPDFTPSIARCASKYYMEDNTPIRFCYTGNRFINNSSYQGRLKESTQSGAELIGDGSVEADAEILALIVSVLLKAGLNDFQVSVGHVDFLAGLFAEAKLGEEKEEEIRRLLMNRNFYGIEEVIADQDLNPDLVYLFQLLHDVMLTKEKISEAKKKALYYPLIYGALERLEKLDDILSIYGVNNYVYYELAMISEYKYYTGIIFAGYTFGSGEAIVSGGRYDKLLSAFGKQAPAIGFGIVIDQLMSALSSQHINIPFENDLKWFVYSKAMAKQAITDALAARKQGCKVELMPLDEEKTKEVYESLAASMKIAEVVYYV